MLRLLLLVCVAIVACDEVELHSLECTLPCYTGKAATRNVGRCQDGTPVCVGDTVTGCQGQTLPSAEVCNGLDDDCDRVVDESVGEEWNGKLCGYTLGVCQSGTWLCLGGKKTCGGDITPMPEWCNDKDDDCNGAIDDIEPTEVCYTADLGTLLYGPCRPGLVLCQNGNERCTHEVTPVPEVCDEIDNDCNGLIDDGLSVEIMDVVFIVDRSCSMVNLGIDRARSVMLRIARTIGDRAAYRFALIGLPTSSSVTPELLSDFVSGSDFVTVAGALTGLGGTSFEPTFDALTMIGRGELGLTPRPGALRLVVLWTDEVGQSFYIPNNTDASSGDALSSAAFMFVGFIPAGHHDSYQQSTMRTGGAIYDLGDEDIMSMQLAEHLVVECQP